MGRNKGENGAFSPLKLLELAIGNPGISILGTYKEEFITVKSKKLGSRRLLRGKQLKIYKCFFALHYEGKNTLFIKTSNKQRCNGLLFLTRITTLGLALIDIDQSEGFLFPEMVIFKSGYKRAG